MGRAWAGVKRAGAIAVGLVVFVVVQVVFRWQTWRERRRSAEAAPRPERKR